MAYLTENISGKKIYLKPVHSFGRDHASVDSPIKNTFASRLQCIIRFKNGAWYIEDKSKNGTIINGYVTRETERIFNLNDTFCVVNDESQTWTLDNEDAPAPILLNAVSGEFIVLSPVNLLPNEKSPDLSIHYDGEEWRKEQGGEVMILESGDTVVLGKEAWRFYANDLVLETQTQKLAHNQDQAKSKKLEIYVSLNEENVRLVIHEKDAKMDFGYKAHHEFLLRLARQCIIDSEQNVPSSEHGWVATDVMLDEFSITENHLNTLIYRLRKSVNEKSLSLPQIERRSGELRLFPSELVLHKGGECLKYPVQ